MYGLYYSEKDNSKFPYQKDLNEIITKSKYFIQSNEANPLTIRLLIADDAINHLQNEVNKFNQQLTKFTSIIDPCIHDYQLESKKIILPITAGSAVSCTYIGIPITQDFDEINLSKKQFSYKNNFLTFKGEELIFRDIIAHMDLYSFFSNFGSILDRFAQEINILFNLKIDNIYWKNLLRKQPGSQKLTNLKKEIKNIRANNQSFFTEFDIYSPIYFEDILQYRHCFIHDGLIKIDPKIENGNLKILLQQDPTKNSSRFTVDAVKLCTEGFNKLLYLLNSSYKYLFEKISKDGQPPLS